MESEVKRGRTQRGQDNRALAQRVYDENPKLRETVQLPEVRRVIAALSAMGNASFEVWAYETDGMSTLESEFTSLPEAEAEAQRIAETHKAEVRLAVTLKMYELKAGAPGQ